MLRRAARRTAKIVYGSAKLFLRIVGFVCLLAAAIFLSVAVFFKVMVTPQSVKAMVVSELQNVLKRPVELDNVNVLWYEGIRIQGLRVFESPVVSGSSANPQASSLNQRTDRFLTSDIVLAKYKWRALLERRLELSELELVSPRIQLLRSADGRWNFEDIFVSSPTMRHAEAHAGRFTLPFSLAADVISVDGGRIQLRDLQRGREYAFRDVNLKVWKFDPLRPFTLRIDFSNADLFGGRQIHTRCAMNGSMSLAGFHWEDSYLSATKISGAIEGKTISASGLLKNLRRPEIDVKAVVPAVDSQFLARYDPRLPPDIRIPPTRWRVRLLIPSTGQYLLESGDVSTDAWRLHASGSQRAQGPSWRWKISAVLPSVSLERLAALREAWGRYRLSGKAAGSVVVSGTWGRARSGSPASFTLEKAAVSVSGLNGVFLKSKLTVSNVDASFSAADNLEAAALSVTNGAATAYGARVTSVSGSVRLDKDHLSADRLSLAWNGSHISMRGDVRHLAAPEDVRVFADVDELKLDDAIDTATRLTRQIKPPAGKPREGPWSRLFKYSFPKAFPSTLGRLRIAHLVHPDFETRNVVLLWNLKGISTGLRKATGETRISFGPGRASDIPTLQASHRILHVVFLPFVFMHKLNNMTVISAATAYPKTLDFGTISAEYGIRSGIVNVRQFYVDSGQLRVFADGTVDFPKEKVSLHVLTRLTSSRGSLPEYLTDEKGRPSIGFFVEDDLNKPTLRIDFHKMAEDAIEDAVRRASARRRPVFQSLEGGKL